MTGTYITTVLIIFGVFALWILVQHASRLYAAKHPELGSVREEGGSCMNCTCHGTEACAQIKERLERKTETENHPV